MFKFKFQRFLENLYFTLLSTLKVIIFSKKNKLPNTVFLSKNCVILGNGPSLNITIKKHHNFIEGKTLIAVNHFAETPLFQKLHPEIYVLNAPEMWRDDVDEFFKVKGIKLFSAIGKNTKWPLQLFIPFEAKKYQSPLEILKRNSNISINYFNPTGIEGFEKFQFYAFAKGIGVPRPHNVLTPTLILAIRLKFSKIYLAGADHNWIKEIYVSFDNNVYLTQKHFYDEHSAKPNTMDKLGKGKRKLHEILEKFAISLEGYFIINKFAKKKNIQVLNITPDSYIDAFNKLNIENEHIS